MLIPGAGTHLLGEGGLGTVVDRLRPDCEFDLEHEGRARLARARLVAAMDGLDEWKQFFIDRYPDFTPVEHLLGADDARRNGVTGDA